MIIVESLNYLMYFPQHKITLLLGLGGSVVLLKMSSSIAFQHLAKIEQTLLKLQKVGFKCDIPLSHCLSQRITFFTTLNLIFKVKKITKFF